METSLKAGFAQIFSCCPKNLSCPKFGGAAALLAPPARTPMYRRLQNSRVFFAKSVKKSVKRRVRVLRVRSALACSRVLEYAKIRTVLQFTSTVLTILLDKGDLVIRGTLPSQVPIMQFQKQGIKYIYLYSVIVFLL